MRRGNDFGALSLMVPVPPRAAEVPHSWVHHGHKRDDPYHWLRAENWRAVMRDPAALDPAIRAHIEAENAYTSAVLARTAALQSQLVREMRARIKEDDTSILEPDGPYFYYWRFEQGGEHRIFCRRPRDQPRDQSRDQAREEILLHGDREAEGHAYFNVTAFEQSPDHRFAAYAVDTNGSEFLRIFLRDLISGQNHTEIVNDAHGDIAWSADSRSFFYTKLDDDHRPRAVFRHSLGRDPATDQLVYREADPAFYVALGRTQSRQLIYITTHDHSSNDVRIVPASRPDQSPQLIAARQPGLEYRIADHGSNLLVLNNADGAEDFKISIAPLSDPSRVNWRDWLPHRAGHLILDLAVYRDYAARLERKNALSRIVITALGDGSAAGTEHVIAFDEEAYSLSLRDGFEYDTHDLRFSYSSLARPQETYVYQMAERTRTCIKTQIIPSGHDASRYVVKRLDAPARDGEQIPVSLIYAKDTPIDGSAPLLLYGYGAYGIAIPPGFSTNRFSLIDRGFVYAIAHIRGGKDKGFRWYRDGKLLKKRNSFNDYIDVAHHLIALAYTRKGRIVGHGGSAGGLLMGAVANMAPELFCGIIAEVPFVDTLTTILDASLPLTPPEWTEWGNPIEDEAVYAYMAGYSPYDNVETKAYPHILALGGLTDPRVTYWEPAKWIAKLRARKAGPEHALLCIDMESGHGGAAGRFDRLKEIALTYAFALDTAGAIPDSRD